MLFWAHIDNHHRKSDRKIAYAYKRLPYTLHFRSDCFGIPVRNRFYIYFDLFWFVVVAIFYNNNNKNINMYCLHFSVYSEYTYYIHNIKFTCDVNKLRLIYRNLLSLYYICCHVYVIVSNIRIYYIKWIICIFVDFFRNLDKIFQRVGVLVCVVLTVVIVIITNFSKNIPFWYMQSVLVLFLSN